MIVVDNNNVLTRNNNKNIQKNKRTHNDNDTDTFYNNNNKRQKKETNSRSNNRLQSARRCGLPQPGLSFELWECICHYLPPSQLVTLAQVSIGMAAIIRSLTLWKNMADHAQLGLPTTRGFRQTYYGVVVSMSQRLCERCFTKCKPSGYKASLPIHDKEINCTIYLCYSCRVHYYNNYPETYNPTFLTEQEQRYTPRHYLTISRYYGGRVGYLEELRKNQSMRETRNKNQQTRCDQRRELLVTELNKHHIWYEETSDPFTRYVNHGRPDFETTWQTLVQWHTIHQERETRTQLIKERLRRMNLDDYYLFGLEANQFVKSGDLPLNEVMEIIRVQAQAEQARKTRHQELMERLQTLHRLDDAGIEKMIQSKESQRFIVCGQHKVDQVIESIVQQLDQQQMIKERQETRHQTIMNLLQENREELDDVAWYCTKERLSEYAKLQWTDINRIISQIKRDARQKQQETKRKEALEQRLRGCGLDFYDNQYECQQYISQGHGSIDTIVSSLIEWDWILRETNVAGNVYYYYSYYGHVQYLSQAISEYISKRLMNLELGSPRHDPCTLSRPPMSLWDHIDRVAPEEWKKHAKACMVEGLLMDNEITETILNNPLTSRVEPRITNQMLITSMNRGAYTISTTQFIHNTTISFTPVTSSGSIMTTKTTQTSSSSLMNNTTESISLTAIPLFSVALHDILEGEENFNHFLDQSREDVMEQFYIMLLF
ncbi:hypothetical protein INT45_011225 [Circinella minor]|uniref:F-box domain-containing protein n=1 Tax=Circinella minor TaxID=1195481 RepID=A0A8H7S4J5_9FUNG|nr:hypothetical protein INT45_011225 [Circinella minor]